MSSSQATSKNSIQGIRRSPPLSKLRVDCPAKVNLYLNTLRKRSDGFHEIESIFHAISLYDYLEIIPSTSSLPKEPNARPLNVSLSPHSTFLVEGNDFFHNNILDRVYRYFRSQYSIPEVKIRLTKHIPIGAGLGGGSSNAAGFMAGLNQMFHLKLSKKKLMRIGEEFGSDVPFFLAGGMAWVGGRGEQVEKHPLSLNQKILIVYPDILMETTRSYNELNTLYPRKNLAPVRSNLFEIARKPERLSDKRKKMFDLISGNLFNSFQKKTVKSYPKLKKTYNLLRNESDFTLMSGSGSSFFALFHDTINLDRAYSVLRGVYPALFKVDLISTGVRVS